MKPKYSTANLVPDFLKMLEEMLSERLSARQDIETPHFDNQVATGVEPKISNLPSFGFIWQGLSLPLGMDSRRFEKGRLEFFYKADISESGGPREARDYLYMLHSQVFAMLDINKRNMGVRGINKLLTIPSLLGIDGGILQLRGEFDILIA